MSLDNYIPQLSRPSTATQLAKALGVAGQIFEFIANNENPELIYRRHLIPKRAARALPSVPIEGVDRGVEFSLSGFDLSRFRVVWEAENPVIRHAHKSAARVLERFLTRPGTRFPHSASFGYVRGRSTRHNASQHIGRKYLLSADIKDFFPSITAARVQLALEEAGLKAVAAEALSRFLTIQGSLPLGLNASPLVANLVALPLDKELDEFARKLGLNYSRYADDVTLSGDEMLPSKDEVDQIFKRHFFRMNRVKFRTSKRGQKHYITGLSVADKFAPHAPRAMKKKLRQELYYIDRYGFADHISRSRCSGTEQHNVNRVDGMVSYISSVEPRHSYRLRLMWEKLRAANNIERSFEPRPVIRFRQASWFVDEAEFVHPSGVSLLAVCLVDVLDSTRLDEVLASFIENEAGDAFGSIDEVSIVRKGIHWVDATWSQREGLVKILAEAPIRAMVAFAPLNNGEGYSKVYLGLLRKILSNALKVADDAVVKIYVEENRSKVRGSDVIGAVSSVHSMLADKNERRPLKVPEVNVVPKAFLPSCCVPDVMLGAFARYATSRAESDRGGLSVTLFERLRSRYSLIFDEYNSRVFHSRSPYVRW
ncbi:reverse transcriptase family protein [Stenotrophomonas maltophilia]|uniref:reverse transcriptase family protein n=1 Tax=Stenotrophomonas maltophilia TaxID=40324 RepID=UPI0039C2CFCB